MTEENITDEEKDEIKQDEKSEKNKKDEENKNEENKSEVVNSNEEENMKELVDSDDEDDCEGYFLEPVGDPVNMAEKIAEANKKLFEEADDDSEVENRPRKVQFSENLIDFEPDADYFFLEPGCEIASITKDVNLNLIPEELHEEIDDETQNFTSAEDEFFESLTLDRESDSLESERNCDEEIAEEIVDEVEFEAKAVLPLTSRKNYEEEQNKLLLILLPQEQNSSCESIIGEDILEDEDPKLRDKELFADGEKVSKPKIARPKSASTFKPKKNCNISNITPNSNRLPDFGRKTWQSSRKYATKAKNKLEKNKKKNDAGLESRTSPSEGFLKKGKNDSVDGDNLRKGLELRRCGTRIKTSYDWSEKDANESRPKTAPTTRTCWVIKSDLPRYNGLRSEYGLSAEQLQERKQKAVQIRHQKKQDKLKERLEEQTKKHQNEEIFQRWLINKSKKKGMSKKTAKTIDTLARSDVYIQMHASYASNHNVPYSIDCSLKRKLNNKIQITAEKKTIKKTIVLEKMSDKISAHFKL